MRTSERGRESQRNGRKSKRKKIKKIQNHAQLNKSELMATVIPVAYLMQMFVYITVCADAAVCVFLSSVERDFGRILSVVDSWCRGTLCAMLHNHRF